MSQKMIGIIQGDQAFYYKEPKNVMRFTISQFTTW